MVYIIKRNGTSVPFDKDKIIMEIKTPGAMPLWLAHALSDCKIYPRSFSKYANAYLDIMKKERE